MRNSEHIVQLLQGYSSLVCIEDGRTSYTYNRLLDEVELWKTRLGAIGVKPGTVVGVMADHSIFSVAVLLALIAYRAITALIPRGFNPQQCLIDAGAGVFLEVSDNGAYSSQMLEHESHHAVLDQLRAAGDGGIVIFTSGSTGRPKAALHSAERFLLKFKSPKRRFRTLAFLLFDHIAGLDTLLYTLTSGGTAVITRRRDPHSVLSIIELRRVQVLPVSPSFLRLLCRTSDIDRYDLSSLKIITYGSEPMDPATLDRLNVLFPHVQISQKYGSTEIGSPRSISRGNNSLWMKLKNDGVEVRVVDNVLWIRSDNAILGYLNAESPIDRDGWYCTGDLVDVDGEWIRFRGRKSDIINVGGHKVVPAEIEQVILELTFVVATMVVGEPHALLGEVVVAHVVLASPNIDTKEALRKVRLHCLQRLAKHKIPMRLDVATKCLTTDRHKMSRLRV